MALRMLFVAFPPFVPCIVRPVRVLSVPEAVSVFDGPWRLNVPPEDVSCIVM